MNAITKIGILNDADLFRQRSLIGGVWRDAETEATVDVVDPASLKVLGTVPDRGGDETEGVTAPAWATRRRRRFVCAVGWPNFFPN